VATLRSTAFVLLDADQDGLLSQHDLAALSDHHHDAHATHDHVHISGPGTPMEKVRRRVMSGGRGVGGGLKGASPLWVALLWLFCGNPRAKGCVCPAGDFGVCDLLSLTRG
jgi:hypothetical protein